MSNIIITDRCNLNCSYCFASESVNKLNIDMDLNEFNNILDYVDKKNVKLCGGEPSLHPDFVEWVEKLLIDPEIKFLTILTNGLWPSHVLGYFKKLDFNRAAKLGFLFNILENEKYSNESRNKLNNTLSAIKKFNFSLGFTIYKTSFDYKFILSLAKKYEAKYIRYSIAAPNISDSSTWNIKPERDFPILAKIVFNFIEDAQQIGINVYSDCGYVPLCYFTKEQQRILALRNMKEKIVSFNCSSPPIDIDKNGNSWRCYGLYSFMNIDINKFENEEKLRKYYQRVTKMLNNIKLLNECIDCEFDQLNICGGGCYSFKIIKALSKNKQQKYNPLEDLEILLKCKPFFYNEKLKEWNGKYYIIEDDGFQEVEFDKDYLIFIKNMRGNNNIKNLINKYANKMDENAIIDFIKQSYSDGLIDFKNDNMLFE